MESLKLSVRELVEFVYKSGDLNTKKLSADRAFEGIRAHKLLQSEMGENYQKEFFLKHEVVIENIMFSIEGRADGIITDETQVTIDEIKSTYTNLEAIDENYNPVHLAQAKCYGYIYSSKYAIDNIAVQLRYYNLDSEKTKIFKYQYSSQELEIFFIELIRDYMDWAQTMISIEKSKKETINELEFPFNSYRKGQRDFSIAVFQTIKSGKKLFAQAPTGVGKTISVLFPAVKAMNTVKNSKIFYLTAKSSTKNIAFNAMNIMASKGLRLRTTVITAKEKICFQDEVNCDPEQCPYARGYYDKVNGVLKNSIKKDYLFSRDYIEEICMKNEICPFEFSLDLSYLSHVVICDYNYYFDPRVAFQREDFLKNSRDILLVDEAHNLEDRARSMYSPDIVKEEFYNVYKIIKDVNKKLGKELRNINKKFMEIKKSAAESVQLLDGEPLDLIRALRKFVAESEIYINDAAVGSIPDEFMDIYFKSNFFIKISEMADNNFCYYSDISNDKTLVKIFLIDPSDILKKIEKNAWSSVFFSATLTPLKYYRYLLGGEDEDYILKLSSPFDENNLNIMITADLSMKYSLRDLNIEKLCEYIHCTITEIPGNYMIFFPSYSFLNKSVSFYKETYDDNITVHRQNTGEEDQAQIVEMFNLKNNVVLFTVVGGTFSEGIDLPLEKLIGAIIIGTGIPQISFERDLIKDFFDEKFKMGYEFAYKYPGFNKVLQSAGRVIRTEEDKGTVLLIDSRLLQPSYVNLFPQHWRGYKRLYRPEELKKEHKI